MCGDKKNELIQIIEKAANEEWIKLDLSIKMLDSLPPEIGTLIHLEELALNVNRLTSLPPEIGNLRNLKILWLSRNRLTELPLSLANLANLEILEVDDNPDLIFPPPEIVQQGSHAILAFLRGQSEASRPQWVSKLLVVGEGGVGKTSLLRALHGKDFDPLLSSTHGIGIEPLELEHPEKADVTMQLSAWDFGGQVIYHATHQFFLTNRSLFLLTWNSRHGYEQGKLYYWLDAIQAKAPESPVLLVATHIDERDADLPLKDICNKYPKIIGQCEISNKTGEGIEALRKAITDAAANLPLMGEQWPATWLNAADAIRTRDEKYITPHELWKNMALQGVPNNDAGVLAQWMHELGDILFFQDDEELNDIVIMKPQWVSEYISQVLESEEVIERFGLLTRTHRDQLWHDIGAEMRDHFLRLMERFDLSYRTLDNREVSLVVERLSFNPPDYEEKWESIKEEEACREISMRFELNTIPPGIPTWFIARSHRFTTYTHWRTGALFTDTPQQKHLALVQSFPHERYLRLTVRGPYPHNFFTLLKDGLELTLERFPGLNIRRMIPCPGHNEERCSHKFIYEQLLKRLEHKKPKFHIECPESFEDVDVRELLFGLVPTTIDDVYLKVNELKEESEALHEAVVSTLMEQHNELVTLLQRQFAKDYAREQSKIETYCPNVFVLRPVKSGTWRRIFSGEEIELQLYCQAPGCWHPTEKGGKYIIGHPADWLQVMAPYIRKMVSLLKYVTPLMGPWISMLDSEYANLIKNDIKMMEELVKKLPEIKKSPDETKFADEIDNPGEPYHVHGSALRGLRQILDAKDPEQDWGGLRNVLTPEGHYLWLCEYHAEIYKP